MQNKIPDVNGADFTAVAVESAFTITRSDRAESGPIDKAVAEEAIKKLVFNPLARSNTAKYENLKDLNVLQTQYVGDLDIEYKKLVKKQGQLPELEAQDQDEPPWWSQQKLKQLETQKAPGAAGRATFRDEASVYQGFLERLLAGEEKEYKSGYSLITPLNYPIQDAIASADTLLRDLSELDLMENDAAVQKVRQDRLEELQALIDREEGQTSDNE